MNRTEIDVRRLPARPPVDGEFESVPPVGEIRVGDLVAIYSRGAQRVAAVEKVGRSRLGCVYTTAGAWEAAIKLQATLSDPTRIDRVVEGERSLAEKNFGYYLRETGDAPRWEHTEEQTVAYRKIVAEGRENFVDRMMAEARERATDDYVKALEGPERYVHVTRKSVPVADVIGWSR